MDRSAIDNIAHNDAERARYWENRYYESCVNNTTRKLIQKYIGSSLKSVEACIKLCPDSAPKYKPLMKTRGELKQILKALKGE